MIFLNITVFAKLGFEGFASAVHLQSLILDAEYLQNKNSKKRV